MLKIFSPTPTSSEIAKSVGKTEGAIRALKKQLPDENIELINLTYKKDNYPFVKIEEFLQIINEDKIPCLFNDHIEAGKIYNKLGFKEKGYWCI